jgi:hypothetical protein
LCNPSCLLNALPQPDLRFVSACLSAEDMLCLPVLAFHDLGAHRTIHALFKVQQPTLAKVKLLYKDYL